MKIDQILEKLCNKEISIQECMQLIISDMEEKRKNKVVEFEVYDKGVKQQDCNLTECIENVKQALRHDVIGQLPNNLILYRQAKKLDYAEFCKWLNTKLGNLR